MDDAELYDILAELDRLEDLREDLEELALNGRTLAELPPDDEVRREAEALGLNTVEAVEARMAELNAQLDRPEGGAS
ncbi:MAG TPA: hypothetical protein VFL91_11095 [Thermomicrobiales bacterium]|nr:hypothetical protein [Thermomicrobiales bacterium]